MKHEITGPDLLAFLDVLDGLDEEASPTDGSVSGMSVERAAMLIEALEDIRKRAGATIALLESRALIQLEGQPRIIGTKAYSRKPNRKKRPNHSAIGQSVRQYAVAREDGEVLPVFVAVDRAISAMAALYVAPTTVPKVGGLQLIGLSEKDAVEWVTLNYELKVTELGEGE